MGTPLPVETHHENHMMDFRKGSPPIMITRPPMNIMSEGTSQCHRVTKCKKGIEWPAWSPISIQTHATHATHATQALALRALRAMRAFKWKPGVSYALYGVPNV